MAARPVIVGVDGSEESLRAAEWAALEAKRRQTGLRIVSVPSMPPRMQAYHAAEVTIANSLRGLAARALAAAVHRVEEIAPGLRIDTGLLTGPPALAVAGTGRLADVLVVGARGAGGFSAMILGSVSRYAATHADCPVVVVREETEAVHREIAVGVRDPDEDSETLAFAFEEAARRGADLVAVHAWYWFPSPLRVPAGLVGSGAAGSGAAGSGAAGSGAAGIPAPRPAREAADPAQISAEAERALHEALRGWRDKYPAVRVREDVVRGHPARVLAGYSGRVDLVVIGRESGPGSGVGSIQHAVLNHAHGTIAIVPAS